MVFKHAILLAAVASLISIGPTAAVAADKSWESGWGGTAPRGKSAPAKRPPPAKKKPARPPSSGGKAKAAPPPADDEAAYIEEDPQAPAPEPVRERPRQRRAPDEEAAVVEPGEASEDEDKPKPRKSRKKAREEEESEEEVAAEEEEEDDDSADLPFRSLPPIVPRLFIIEVGASLAGRNFAFNTPLQTESAFPRIGVAAALESYPLIRQPRGWWKKLGIGVSYGRESGRAATAAMGGSEISYAVVQSRWTLDVRYAIPLGARVVVVPALGYGSSGFDLRREPPVDIPSCVGTAMGPCLPDVNAKYLLADVHLRIAATSTLGLSLTAGYFLGVDVQNGPGQIAAQVLADVGGFHVDFGGTLLINQWFALRLAIPIRRYSFNFNPGATYSAATETRYGATFGAVVFTR